MSLVEFEPENELEAAIAQGQRGALPIDKVLAALLAAPMFISSMAEVAEDGSGFEPLLLDDDGAPLIAVFSSWDRPQLHFEMAAHIVQRFGRDFLRMVPEGYGIIVNPGYTAQFVIGPEGMADIRRQLGGG